jgi:hypothetical protein
MTQASRKLLKYCTLIFQPHKQNRYLRFRSHATSIALSTIFALLIEISLDDLTSEFTGELSPLQIVSSSRVATPHRHTSSFSTAGETAEMA